MRFKSSIDELIEESDIDPKVWFRIKLVFFTVLFSVLFAVIATECSRGNCARYYSAIDKQFSGQIVRKFRRKHNHNLESIELDNGRKPYLMPFDELGIYEVIKVGDSIVKPKGKLLCYLIRSGDTLTFEIKEPDCVEYLK